MNAEACIKLLKQIDAILEREEIKLKRELSIQTTKKLAGLREKRAALKAASDYIDAQSRRED